MAIIVREHRLLFILAPHTASTAIGTLLVEELGGEWIPAADIRDGSGRLVVPRKHTTVPELLSAGLISPEERKSLLVFSAVRNPFDALVSTYLKHRGKDQALLDDPDAWVHGRKRKLENLRIAPRLTFDQWVEHTYRPRWRDRIRLRSARQERWPFDRDVDVIMRHERIQADLDEVLRRAGVPGEHPIPRENTTPDRQGRDYRTYYTPRARKLVEAAFANFLQRYGYTF